MKTDEITRSVDKLQDALGMIDDQYIEEAHENREDAEKRSARRWSKRMRIAGILAAAACVILIAAAVILLPKRDSSKMEAAADMTVQETAVAGNAEIYEEAVAEEEAYDAAAGSAEVYEEAAAEVPEQAEGSAEMAAGDEMDMSGAAALEAAGSGQAVAVSLTVAESGTLPFEELFRDGNGLLIRSEEQLARFLENAGFVPDDDAEAAEQWKAELTGKYDSAFFKEKSLAVSFVELTSGSYEMIYLYTSEEGGTAEQHYMVYRADSDPSKDGAVVTADMALWLLLSEVDAGTEKVITKEEAYPYE